MGFDWQDYLKLAKGLSEWPESEPLNEASYRAAISRAYYAVYHVARVFLYEKDHDKGIPSEHAHSYIREKFLNHPLGGNYHVVGRKYEDLLRLRVKADYRDTYKPIPALTKHVVKTAQETIDLINNL